MINALVIDLEHWHCIELLRNHQIVDPVDQVLESVMPILDLLSKYKIKATFAVLGTVAEQHPQLIAEICDHGHEIASHAWSHKTLHELGRDAFEDEILKSISLLESITGEKPIGFRAPSFSLDNSTKWALDILEKYNFEYDASIFPMKTILYGVPGAPLHIYRPDKEDLTREDPDRKIVEFPQTVLDIGVTIPMSGGFYYRVLPFEFIKYSIHKINRKRPALLYFHPWEMYSPTPRIKMSLFSSFITYHGINSLYNKFEILLKEFKFDCIKNVIKYNLGE